MGGKSLALLFGFASILLPFEAGAWELSVSTGVQRELFRGWVKYKGTEVDVKDDLHLSDKSKITLSATLRHDIPPLPDLKVDYLRVKTSGTGRLSKTITFGDTTFTANDTIKTDFKADQFDFTFFYTPVEKENFAFRWGLGVKYLTGYVNIKSLSSGAYSDTDYDIPVPYLFLGGDLKFALLRAGFEGKGLAYSGSYFYDWKLFVGLEKGRFFVNAGYRYQRLKIDDVEDFSSDLKIKGFFGEVGIKF